MASRYEVEVTIDSARDLKNVNWRYGPIKPYAVLWIDPAAKCSTKADLDGDTNPTWDDKLTVPLPADRPLDDAVLHIDIVHAGPADGVKPLIGSAKLPLREVLDEAGMGGKCTRTLKLKRPSGRPHGKLDVKVKVAPRDQPRYNDPYAPPYGQGARDPYGGGYAAPPPSGYPYGAGAPAPYGAPQPAYAGYGAPPSAYGQTGYAVTQTQTTYGQTPAYGGYGDAPKDGGYGAGGSYGAAPVVVEEKKKSKFGMGTGLALGAAGGLLGGLAIYEGAEFVENKIDDEVDERVAEREEEQFDEDY